MVLFFFNSFEEEMVRLWLDRLVEAAATRPAPIDLIYMHPEHHKVLAAIPGIQILADTEIAFSPGDAAADAFGVSIDRCTIYRLLIDPSGVEKNACPRSRGDLGCDAQFALRIKSGAVSARTES